MFDECYNVVTERLNEDTTYDTDSTSTDLTENNENTTTVEFPDAINLSDIVLIM